MKDTKHAVVNLSDHLCIYWSLHTLPIERYISITHWIAIEWYIAYIFSLSVHLCICLSFLSLPFHSYLSISHCIKIERYKASSPPHQHMAKMLRRKHLHCMAIVLVWKKHFKIFFWLWFSWKFYLFNECEINEYFHQIWFPSNKRSRGRFVEHWSQTTKCDQNPKLAIIHLVTLLWHLRSQRTHL